jgi:hypothetical protein
MPATRTAYAAHEPTRARCEGVVAVIREEAAAVADDRREELPG